MAEIESILKTIIDAVKNFISKVEEIGSKVITQLEIYSEKLGQELFSLLKATFEKVRTTLTRIFETFKSKISRLSNRILSKKPSNSSGQSIATKIRNATRDSFRKISEVTKNFGEKAAVFAEETGHVLGKISSGVETGVVKTLEEAKIIGKGAVEKLMIIGEFAIKETKNIAKGIYKEVELAGDFVYKHGIEVASAAGIGFLDVAPPLFLGFAVAGILIYSASKYDPETESFFVEEK